MKKPLIIAFFCFFASFSTAQEAFVDNTLSRYGIVLRPEKDWLIEEIVDISWSPAEMLRRGAALSINVFSATLSDRDKTTIIFLPLIIAVPEKGQEFSLHTAMRHEVYWSVERHFAEFNGSPYPPEDFDEMKFLDSLPQRKAKNYFNASKVYKYNIECGDTSFWRYLPGTEEFLTNIPEEQELLESESVSIVRYFIYSETGKAYHFLVVHKNDRIPRNLERIIGHMISFW